MKIAILYSGLIRTLTETIDNNLNYFGDAEIDLYFSTWTNVGYTDQINAPDNVISARKLDEKTVITEQLLRHIVPAKANIKKVKIETYQPNMCQFDLVNGLDRVGLAPQYYKTWDCYRLLEGQYDAVVKLRCDLFLRQQIDLDYLFGQVAEDKIVIPSKTWYDFTYQTGNNSVNEMMWIANQEVMKKACSIYINQDKINAIIRSNKQTHLNYGESISLLNFQAEGLVDGIRTFDFDYLVMR